jgi:hypothetical protein
VKFSLDPPDDIPLKTQERALHLAHLVFAEGLARGLGLRLSVVGTKRTKSDAPHEVGF